MGRISMIEEDLTRLMKLIIGQKLIGITQESNNIWQLHFDDFVLFVKDPYPSPIIKREQL
jgi:hypothetical protein